METSALSPPGAGDGALAERARGRPPAWQSTALAAAAVAAGTAWAVVAELQQVGHADRPLSWLAGDFIAGWTFILTGAIAWARRRDSRIGPLLLLIGITWFVGTFNRAGLDWVAHLARSFQGFYEPLLGVLLLTYPTGRITGRIERIVVGAWLLEQACWTLARLILDRPLSWYSCATCPETIDAFIADRQLLDVLGPASLALATVLAIGVVVLGAARLLRAGPAGRRRLAPTLLVGASVLFGTVGSAGFRLLVDAQLFDEPATVAIYHVVLMFAAVAVLAGMLQERLARTGVADLVIDLRRDADADDPDPRHLRDALARALGDPGIELFLRDRATGTFRDLGGLPVDLPHPTARRAVTRVGGSGDDLVAVIAHDPSLLDDPGLVTAVTTALRLEADNRQLGAEVERQLSELRESRARIVAATDAERRRVERDLHDGAQQRLVALSMELGRVRAVAAESGDGAMLASLGGLSAELESAIEELRELARGILPPVLTDAGLAAALESLAIRAPVPVELEISLSQRLPAAIESTLYFVIAEGLTNATRHAAASRATVRVELRGDRVWAQIEDNGVGGAEVGRGTGLQGLGDRVGALGGTFHVDSRRGAGTRLAVELPVAG